VGCRAEEACPCCLACDDEGVRGFLDGWPHLASDMSAVCTACLLFPLNAAQRQQQQQQQLEMAWVGGLRTYLAVALCHRLFQGPPGSGGERRLGFEFCYGGVLRAWQSSTGTVVDASMPVGGVCVVGGGGGCL
jgi:hypothetical protein